MSGLSFPDARVSEMTEPARSKDRFDNARRGHARAHLPGLGRRSAPAAERARSMLMRAAPPRQWDVFGYFA